MSIYEKLGYNENRVNAVKEVITELIKNEEIDFSQWNSYTEKFKHELAINYAGLYNICLFLIILNEIYEEYLEKQPSLEEQFEFLNNINF